MRFYGYGYFFLFVFQCLLFLVVFVWLVVNFFGKFFLVVDVGVFLLDSFYCFVLVCYEECIDVYIYYKFGSVYVNFIVIRNVCYFLELNFICIFCVMLLVKQMIQFVYSVIDNVIYVIIKEKVCVFYFIISQIFCFKLCC